MAGLTPRVFDLEHFHEERGRSVTENVKTAHSNVVEQGMVRFYSTNACCSRFYDHLPTDDRVVLLEPNEGDVLSTLVVRSGTQ